VHRIVYRSDPWARVSEDVDLDTGIDVVLANEKPEVHAMG
jgi:hypothetical protein